MKKVLLCVLFVGIIFAAISCKYGPEITNNYGTIVGSSALDDNTSVDILPDSEFHKILSIIGSFSQNGGDGEYDDYKELSILPLFPYDVYKDVEYEFNQMPMWFTYSCDSEDVCLISGKLNLHFDYTTETNYGDEEDPCCYCDCYISFTDLVLTMGSYTTSPTDVSFKSNVSLAPSTLTTFTDSCLLDCPFREEELLSWLKNFYWDYLTEAKGFGEACVCNYDTTTIRARVDRYNINYGKIKAGSTFTISYSSDDVITKHRGYYFSDTSYKEYLDFGGINLTFNINANIGNEDYVAKVDKKAFKIGTSESTLKTYIAKNACFYEEIIEELFGRPFVYLFCDDDYFNYSFDNIQYCL